MNPVWLDTRLSCEASPKAETFRPLAVSREFSDALSEGIRELALRMGTGVRELLLACWQLLLWRSLGEGDFAVGAELDGRSDAGTTEALGLFARCLPVPSGVDSVVSFEELVRRTAERTVELSRWQEYFSWEQLGGAESVLGEESFLPFGFDYDEMVPCFAGGLTITPLRRLVWVDRCRIKLSCREAGETLTTELHFDSSSLEHALAERLLGQLYALTEAAVREPHRAACELSVLGRAERHAILVELNATEEPSRDRCLHQLFESQVAQTPDAVAVIFEGARLTFGALNRRADDVAGRLQRLGVERESIVVLCMERGVEFVIGVLGVLKAGGAYVPLDPEQPRRRLAVMLEEARAAALLSTSRLVERLPSSELPVLCLDAMEERASAPGSAVLPSATTPGDLAYLIFTSGSTGRPKAVGVEHRQIVNYVTAIRSRLGLRKGEQFALVSTTAADLGNTALFPPLCDGGSLHVISAERAFDAAAFAEYVGRDPIDLLKIVPSHLAALGAVSGWDRILPREQLVLGGEACPAELVRELEGAAARCAVFNHYGPTESTVGVLTHRAREQGYDFSRGSFPLGRPIGNARVYVLDARLNPVPVGTPGELHIGGAPLARGYLDRPELTAARFLPDPFAETPGSRIYRTGDLCRLLQSGEVEFIDRVDRQLKIRGFRVEIGEIEAALEGAPGVERAVVMPRGSSSDRRLLAYVVPRERKAVALSARPHSVLGNGLAVAHLNPHETDYQFQEIFLEGTYVRHGIELADGDCVFDVGANIGMATLFFHFLRRDLRIYSFEPIPSLYDILRFNTELYAIRARLFPLGLSDRSKEVEISYYPGYSIMSGFYADAREERETVRTTILNRERADDESARALLPHLDEFLERRFASERLTCRLRSLSEVMREEQVERIDLLKIDVQKSELDVLRGVAPQDWTKIRQVVLEAHDAGGRLSAIEELLARQGFDVVVEQDALLQGTDRYHLYASRKTRERRAARAIEGAYRESPVTAEGLRQLLKERLPDYMCPSHYIFLEALPLTSNGKVDRNVLSALEAAQRQTQNLFAAPESAEEQALARVWSELLGVERVSVHDNFFELGGHSLLAMQLVSRIRELFQIEVPLRALFEAPTIAALCRTIKRGGTAVSGPPIKPIPREGELPLSFAQERLWFLDQLVPGSPFYNLPGAIRIRGELNLPALRSTFEEVCRRHEVLRTTFLAVEGRAVAVVSDSAIPRIPLVNLGSLGEARREATLEQLAASEARQPFDLRRGPLIRIAIVLLAPRDHALILNMHHIVSDGWSHGVLLREVTALYRAFSAGQPSPLPEPTIQYVDFASWQRDRLSEVVEVQLTYWRERLSNLRELELPTDRPRPAMPSFRGERYRFELSAHLSQALGALGSRAGSTLFMTLLAAFQVLLAGCSRQRDHRPGLARRRPHPGGDRGPDRILREYAGADTICPVAGIFARLLVRVREAALGAFAHQEMPFEKLVEELQPQRDLSRAPPCFR